MAATLKTCARALLLAGVLGAAAPALAGPPPTPEKVTVCAACHGADGKAMQPIYPHLAGQYANYLEHALRDYRDGKRKNPIMAAQAATLTDAEIRQLAEYFARQVSPLYTPSVAQRQN
jgi:cytochrome c553